MDTQASLTLYHPVINHLHYSLCLVPTVSGHPLPCLPVTNATATDSKESHQSTSFTSQLVHNINSGEKLALCLVLGGFV